VVSEHRVTGMFTAPTAIRAIKKEDALGERLRAYDISSCARCSCAGSGLDPDTWRWAGGVLGVPGRGQLVADRDRLAIAANLRGLAPMEIKPGTPSVPVPG
jgi:propionyl-CoA synthetase